jgi:hypothetical protein
MEYHVNHKLVLSQIAYIFNCYMLRAYLAERIDASPDSVHKAS